MKKITWRGAPMDSPFEPAKEHLWRALGVIKLFKELTWSMQQQEHAPNGLTFVELNPEALRLVITMLGDELERAIAYLDQLESAELDAAQAKAPAHERRIIGLLTEPNPEPT
jgi:hypothetical protein